MVERRRPLVLSSTKSLVDSVLSSSRLEGGELPSELKLPAGILRFARERVEESDSRLAKLDDAALVGLSTSALKRLSITSGSLVHIRNLDTNSVRMAQVVVLDPPSTLEHSYQVKLPFSQCEKELLIFPSCSVPPTKPALPDREVAYLSPLLAFNLSLHLSCFRTLVHHGEDSLTSFFRAKVDNGMSEQGGEVPAIDLELKPLGQLPKYASHLRVSFVKLPECGTIESLKGSSSVEAEDRQEMIDLALQNYFEIDRHLAIGDVFSIKIKWSCNSFICIRCSQNLPNDDVIYFKVVAMEPSDNPVLRVNRTKTALVLGGNVPSGVPPDLLCDHPKSFAPLQGDTVKILASVLTPSLCSSMLAVKFRVAVLLSGLTGCGKRTVVRFVARRLGLHVVEFSCNSLMSSSERKTSIALAEAFNTAQRYSPSILLLRHFDAFRNLGSNEGLPNDQNGISSELASVIREFTIQDNEDDDVYAPENLNGDLPVNTYAHKVFLVATADSTEGLPPTVRRCFSHEITMGPLTEEQRVEMLSQSLKSISDLLPNSNPEDFVRDIVGQTSGFIPRDLNALIADTGANIISGSILHKSEVDSRDMHNKYAEDKTVLAKDVNEAVDQVLRQDDLAQALERSKKRNAVALGTPKVPDVKWEDVGGLEDVKKSILDTVQLPLLHKDLFSSGLRKRSGVLLYGPPGTGKTLLAKAVATECSLNFLSVKGPELINMYIGESEKNVRDIFQKARSARPCVIFFDELDSLAPARGASGDSGGVMDRVVSQMLAEIDGLNDATQDLFVIGASNRPDLIDPALLRPGRFDKLLYVGVNTDVSNRERVLKALTRKFKLHEDVSLYSVAKKCPPNFTGADMYALCADAWFHAAKSKVLSSGVDSSSKDLAADSVVVEYEDFVEVLGELSPSLSMAELKKYELLRDQLEGSSK
ncbi:peroxisome biogenesis protein 6 isoform X2 [Rhodamnia argentea]|uniref:Peroxisomal ATPase PEX6 n=1 Tax=Rhodamnia argentea TaxID=178133 RepID=A0ABM3GY86_9MYRT|nr:peroxisome biogenesis protein 6 isoform X2 [Rhodamnia argentea]